MTSFKLNDINLPAILSEEIFPPLDQASEEGVVAYGGDLSPRVLLNAYSHGIFPWFSVDEVPIMWWSPDPRMVLYPEELHISKTMRKILKKKIYTATFDQMFKEVIENCRMDRPNQPGTWITENMKRAYLKLHTLGFAHSLEVWKGSELAGGLYGIALGRCFFGESMFSIKSNASKYGFISLVRSLQERNYQLIDCQVSSDHLASLGAREIPREKFIQELKAHVSRTTERGAWGNIVKIREV